MCLVAFQKIFRKIFSSVWKRRRKRQTQKNGQNPEKKIINDRRSIGFDGAVLRELQSDDCAVDRDRRRDLAKARSRSSRDRNRWRDLTKARSRSSRSRIAIVGLELVRSARTGARGSSAIVGLDWSSVFFLLRARSLSLSLSLSLRKYFEVKMKV